MKEKHSTRKGRSAAQGIMEITAYYVERVIGLNRKPPVIGRAISNKIFYKDDQSPEAVAEFVKDEYFLPVSVIPWVDDLHTLIPIDDTEHYLTMQQPLPSGDADLEHIRQLTETIMFDFLVDDHDRLRTNGNWKVQKNTILFWDSGISFDHGPRGREDGSCLDLLCGPKNWRVLEEMEANGDLSSPEAGVMEQSGDESDFPCYRICRFSERMVTRLRELSNTPSDSLGRLVEERLVEDPLWPVFSYGVYYPTSHHTRDAKVHFWYSNFVQGLDEKNAFLLTHIDECIAQYGEHEVLF